MTSDEDFEFLQAVRTARVCFRFRKASLMKKKPGWALPPAALMQKAARLHVAPCTGNCLTYNS